MSDQTDAQLLREYAEAGSEAAFREIVVRYTDLVYSSALRQVGSPDLARDVAQSVFADLAAKARSLVAKPAGESLAGWLFRGTRFAALNLLRDDRRRLARERQAMEHFETASETARDWERVRPVLDEALADLSNEDREALLQRFFRSRDFRAIGQSLGVSDDAAQKRVSRALDRLRDHLTSRGVTAGTAALATALSANALTTAPAGLAVTLSTTALAGSGIIAAAAAAATKAIAMTTLQKTLVTATVVLLAGAGIYEARQAAQLREQNRALQQQQAPLTEQIQQLQAQRNEASNQLAALIETISSLNGQSAELARLRGEVARLRQATAGKDAKPLDGEARAWTERVNRLKAKLEQNPGARIPELDLLTEREWLYITKAELNQLNSEEDYRRAFGMLRNAGVGLFAHLSVAPALRKYRQANAGQFPADLSQLKPYFESPVDDAILQRYEILPATELPGLKLKDEWMVTQRTPPLDADYDHRYGIDSSGYTFTSFSEAYGLISVDSLATALASYLANTGQSPTDPSQLLPFATTSEEQTALKTLVKQFPVLTKNQKANLQKQVADFQARLDSGAK
jgi:RNA polymerase sigma factor (sigma-70 family)